MALVQIDNIEKLIGERLLFHGLSWTIYEGERVGLIGDNGSGKSTLFKMLLKEMTPDSGTVVVSQGVKIGHLAQDPVFSPGHTVFDEAEMAFADLHALGVKLRTIEHDMATAEGEALDKLLEKYTDVQHEFEMAGGYAVQHRIEGSLLSVGLDKTMWERPVEVLSGGQRSRLALAKLVVDEPDLLLLDEPTNHLDLEAIATLEEFLLTYKGSVVIISHDRYLLDRLSTRVCWLTGAQMNSYPGNFTNYMEQRELHEISQRKARALQQADIAKQEEYIRRFKAGQRARQAAGREKRLERLKASDEIVSAVTQGKHIHLNMSTDQRAGDRVLKVSGLSKSFGDLKLWLDIGFEVKRGERIGIIGPNGSGKTTLLRCLLGEDDADGGDIRWGSNLTMSYYDQRLDTFDPDATVLETAWETTNVKEQQVKDMLGMLRLGDEAMDKVMSSLSGGERARVRLAQILLEGPNVLLMDEPTNHLDIPSCQALENALSQFPGTLVCVSHDRYFLNQIVRRLLVLDPPGVLDFEGTFAKYQEKQRQLAADVVAAKAAAEAAAKQNNRKQSSQPVRQPQKQQAAVAVKAAPVAQPAKKKENAYLRPFGKYATAELDKMIKKTEAQVASVEKRLADPGTFRDAGKMRSAQAEHETLAQQLAQMEEEYLGRDDAA